MVRFYADRERNNPSFLNTSKMLNFSTFGNTADIYDIVHTVPHACQHIKVDQSHSSGDTVVKMWWLAESGGTKTVSFTKPKKEKWHGVNSGDRCGHWFNTYSSFPVRPIHLCICFDWDTIARLWSVTQSRLFESWNHYCLHQLWHLLVS